MVVTDIKAVLGLDLVCVFESEKIVRNMNPIGKGKEEWIDMNMEMSRHPLS